MTSFPPHTWHKQKVRRDRVSLSRTAQRRRNYFPVAQRAGNQTQRGKAVASCLYTEWERHQIVRQRASFWQRCFAFTVSLLHITMHDCHGWCYTAALGWFTWVVLGVVWGQELRCRSAAWLTINGSNLKTDPSILFTLTVFFLSKSAD